MELLCSYVQYTQARHTLLRLWGTLKLLSNHASRGDWIEFVAHTHTTLLCAMVACTDNLFCELCLLYSPGWSDLLAKISNMACLGDLACHKELILCV